MVNQLIYRVSHKLRCFKHPKWCRFLMLLPRLASVSESKLPCGGSVAMHGNRCTRQVESNKDGQIFDHIWRFFFSFFFLNYTFFESFPKKQAIQVSLSQALLQPSSTVCHRQVRWLLQQPGLEERKVEALTFIKATNSFKMKRVFGLMEIIEYEIIIFHECHQATQHHHEYSKGIL